MRRARRTDESPGDGSAVASRSARRASHEDVSGFCGRASGCSPSRRWPPSLLVWSRGSAGVPSPRPTSPLCSCMSVSWLSEAPPATDREFAVAWDTVGTIRSESTRRFLQAQLLLARGAGLKSAEIRVLPGSAVFRRPDAGLWVRVEGPGPVREVPVLRRFADDLGHLAIDAGPRCLIADCLPPAPAWRNKQFSRALGRRLQPLHGTSAPNPGRLRRAWIAEQLTMGTPIPTLLRAAGLGSFRALTGLIQYASDPVMSVEELAVRMGGVEPPGRGERG